MDIKAKRRVAFTNNSSLSSDLFKCVNCPNLKNLQTESEKHYCQSLKKDAQQNMGDSGYESIEVPPDESAEESTKENLDEEYDENMDEENLDDEMNVKPSGNSTSNKDKSDSAQQLIRCSRCCKLLRRKSQQAHSVLCKVKYLNSNFECRGIIEMDSILSINNTICTVKHNNNEFSITLDKHKNSYEHY